MYVVFPRTFQDEVMILPILKDAVADLYCRNDPKHIHLPLTFTFLGRAHHCFTKIYCMLVIYSILKPNGNRQFMWTHWRTQDPSLSVIFPNSFPIPLRPVSCRRAERIGRAVQTAAAEGVVRLEMGPTGCTETGGKHVNKKYHETFGDQFFGGFISRAKPLETG